ncbi:hypothetical protein RRG08_044751 [Elysia crispata]|uniref:Uncharacterized protein n=1 Tax=Elysia crispata TaxID=231223 RepID=A0AAE0ZIT9_9GAST|nr:hypothetical protein RRG08_044751 [Elysia crispata]
MQYRDPSTRKTKTALEASNVTLVPLVTAVTILLGEQVLSCREVLTPSGQERRTSGHPGGATPVQLTVARGTQACDWGGGGKSDSQDLFMEQRRNSLANLAFFREISLQCQNDAEYSRD